MTRQTSRRIIALMLALWASLVLFNRPQLAQAQSSSLLDSKVARLEFVVQNLELRINQLSAQVSTPSGVPPRSSARISQPPSAQRPSGVSRQEFENLTTLVLELKEDMKALGKT
ncbi:MAG: hypothetical protein HC857_04075 [Synechococcales cyanobacterium RU_4_20]|nr:hypothetical protein [Synechococcales cyanobacterium RU_4_20]